MNDLKKLTSHLSKRTYVTALVAIGFVIGGVGVADAVVKTCVGGGACNGTNGDDHITGNASSNNISALGGHDNAWGKQGNDTMNGGDSADFIEGNPGHDTIYGYTGNDHPDYLAYNGHRGGLWGGWGNDGMHGNAGFDHVVGEGGSDTLAGGPNNDWVYAFDCERDRFSGGGGPSDICWVDLGIDINNGGCETIHRYTC